MAATATAMVTVTRMAMLTSTRPGIPTATRTTTSIPMGTRMATTMDMGTGTEAAGQDAAAAADRALLQLLWLASPALPVGGFSYSEGLEAAVEAGLVRDEASAGDWLLDQLHLTLARADLAVVAQAVQAARDQDDQAIDRLDAWVRRTRESGEFRLQVEQMGRSLGEWGASLAHDGLSVPASRPPAHSYPVAFALAAALGPAAPRQVALAYAFAWAENMMQAAIKAVPLGQSSGQRILARLAAAIPVAVDAAAGLAEDQRQAFSPMLAILSAQHENQYSRLFRS